MLSGRIVIASAMFTVAATSTVARADELSDRIEALPGVTIVTERPAPAGYRFFVLSFEQRVNHFMPWKGTFQQQVALLHRGEDRPTVVHTSGYGGSTRVFQSEPTALIDGNQIQIEHRFFASSIPVPTDWNDLTIFQAASDHHRIIQTLKQINPCRYLSTGASKGGMATVYHRRFYERDIDGSVVYVAPNDVVDFIDRYDDFLDHVGDDPGCRQALRDLQREALVRRATLVPMMLDFVGPGETFDLVGGIEKAFELVVLETEFTFWQYGAQENCAFVPPVTASDEEILFFMDDVVSLFYPTDIVITFFRPYFFQAGMQINYPEIPQDHVEDLLLYKDGDVPDVYLPRELERRNQLLPMIDIDLWVRYQGSELLFIYGEIDPYSAETFHLGPGTRDSLRYVVAGGNHRSAIRNLPPDQQAEAISAVRRWAGVDDEAAPAAARTAAPAFEPEPPRDHRHR